MRRQAAGLSRRVASARQSEACQIFMSIPGVGTVTAMSFAPAIEDPANLRKSRSIGAWLGLTPKRYQSGEVDSEGHISRRRYPRGRTSQARKALHNGPRLDDVITLLGPSRLQCADVGSSPALLT
jgi:transposase